ncbi:hypothetical protein NU08_0565 [Flavobacterium anhuiense]|uniref:Uncharacterized protein n=1 Tax=Flavobacterium anhuiense TaxID=459526 RepID=A0A444W624_9FLAO|nr:hypothetical protein [Flavobacterium anhuiense]RYJ41128.1 hypothetical protein NU08_0565 [Flavobacterium anhuiense]
MSDKLRRVVFYSINDLSAGINLKTAEEIIKNFDENKTLNINDILELYNIQLYFDNDLRLNSWTDEIFFNYKDLTKKFDQIIKNFFLQIDNSNIDNFIYDIDFNYTKHFLNLFNKYNTFKKTDYNKIAKLIEKRSFIFNEILTNKETVNYYSANIANHFEKNPITAEIILSFNEEKSLEKKETIFFPKALNNDKIELIINNYIATEKPNLNYLNLIINSKNLKLSDKTKFKAAKKEKEITTEYFSKNSGISYGVEVSISKDQMEPKKEEYDIAKNRIVHSYSSTYLDSSKEFTSIFKNFILLFEFINFQGCINLVKRNSEIDTLEKVFMRSNGEYLKYTKFNQKEFLSNAQLMLYKYYLKKKNIDLENVLKFIVSDTFTKVYEINNLKINFPSKETGYFEKVRILAPELEFLLKQYKAFIEDGEIDFELLQFNSSPLYFSTVKSGLSVKYVYGFKDDFLRINNCLFSSQLSLAYIEPFKSKYNNLHDLLLHENVTYNSFENFQKNHIDFLIEKKVIFINKKNNLELDSIMSLIFSCLHYQEVISFWHFPYLIREKLIELKEKNILEFDNSLFTREEMSYFNYNLNKKEHTNGLDLRNKYAHGSNSHSEEVQESDYNIILKILILILLKIEDDRMLLKKQTN